MQATRLAGLTTACLCGMNIGYAVAGTGDADIVRAKQSVKGGDGTILNIWGVGVRRGSDWQEIDGGMGVKQLSVQTVDVLKKSLLLLKTNKPVKIPS